MSNGEGLQPVGFIGIGNMGTPLTERLVARGYRVRVFDPDPQRVAAASAFGALAADSAFDVVEPGGVAITMVPDDEQLRAVTLGDRGVMAAIGEGGIHVSMSTVSPAISDELSEHYADQGSQYLAAPVLGRPDAAAAGRLSILIAGETEAKHRVMPLLSAVGSRICDLGERPAGANVLKIAVNFLIMSAIEALGEATALIERAGLDRSTLTRILADSPLFSGAVYEGYGEMIAQHRYLPALFAVPLGIKDAELAENSAAAVGARLPLASLVRAHLEQAITAGWADEDWAVIGRVLAEA